MGRLGYQGGPNVITRVKEGSRRVRVRVMLSEKDDRTLLALKRVGDHEQRNRESPKRWKRQKTGFSVRAHNKECSPISDF